MLSSLLSLVVLVGCSSTGHEDGLATAGRATTQPVGENPTGPLDLAMRDAGPGAVGDGVQEALASTQFAGEALASQTESVSSALPGSLDYRLNPLDVVEVSVFQVPELSRTVQVNPVGQISLPLIGAVTAGGKTTAELEREIAQRLGERYLQSPAVSVLIKEYQSQRVTVDGAVNSPGVYQIAGQAGLLQVIALAKGLDRVADPGGIMVFRMKDGQRQAAVFDIRPIRRGQAPDPQIMGGDVIVVDQSASRTAWRGLRESLGVIGFFRPFIL